MPARSAVARTVIVALVSGPLLQATPASQSLGQTPTVMGGGGALGQAAGNPIFDCTGMANTAARMKVGLPQQDEWIRKEEERLREARAGITESKAEMQKALIDGARKLVENQLEYVKEAKDAIENAKGLSELTRHKWIERYDLVKKAGDAVEKSIKSGSAGAELGTEIAKNRATLDSALNFFRESGISDDLAETAAKSALAAKLISPGSALLVQMFPVALDVLFAGAKGVMSANELDAARANLDAMRAASNASKARVYELEQTLAAECAPKPPSNTDRTPPRNPPPATTPATPPTTPPAPAAPTTTTPPKRGGGGGGAILAGLVLGGGIAAGAYYYATKVTNTDGGGGSGSVNMSYVSSSSIICTFNSGGLINSCTGTVTVNITGSISSGSSLRLQFARGPAGTRTTTSNPPGQTTFSLSGGTGSQTCPSSLGEADLFNVSQSATNVIAFLSSVPLSITCR